MKPMPKTSSAERYFTVKSDSVAEQSARLAAQVSGKVEQDLRPGSLVGQISPTSIREGLPFSHVAFLFEQGISRKELIAVTKIPSATLDRRKKSGRLNPVESDKLYRLMTIVEAAQNLFNGDQERALAWCRKPARALGDQAPIELSDTTAGQDMVMDYIGRIEHGVVT